MTTKVDYTSTELPADLAAAFEAALRRLRSEEPPAEEHIVAGVRRTDGVMFERFDPCHPGVRVAAAHSATTELVSEAVSVARKAFKDWRKTTVEQRCGPLLDEEFEALLFAHGDPLTEGAREALTAFAGG